MFFCPVCTDTFNVITSMIRHIKVMHNFCNNFQCRQNNCCRLFHTLLAFKRHLSLKHAAEETTSTSNALEIVTYNVNELYPNTTNCETNDSEGDRCNLSEKEIVSFQECLTQKTTLFISKMYSNYSLPRNLVQDIINNVSELLRKPLEILRSHVDASSLTDNEKNPLLDHITCFSNLFANLTSEYSRINFFKCLDSFIEPACVAIGQTVNDKKVGARVTLEIKEANVQYIPIGKVLKSFLELPNVFESICSYIENLESNSSILINIIQGELWQKTKIHFHNKLVMPIFLYADDFEICNPLGSHAGVYKVCGIYISLGCIPPEYSALLENIFLTQLCYSNDVKTFGNSQIFKRIIDDLVILENEGIDINIKGNNHSVYFNLALVLGDNLGMNSILGLNESFNSDYYCRFCRCDKAEATTKLYESKEQLRSPENYQEDLLNLSNGIKEICVWHKLPIFHMATNMSCDIMHDIFEGVCRYDMGNLLYRFICKEKFFTLDELNHRIRFFNFGQKNKPPAILKSQILKKNLIMSASEMSSLVLNFSLIIGDRVPHNNPAWEMYLVLVEIIQITTSKVIHRQDVELLKVLIAEHHALYLELFGKLKPKFHFMIHYPNLILKVGPLANISSIRFEARHREFKNAARSTASRKNILYTLALKNQLAFCYRIISQNGFFFANKTGSEDLDFTNSLYFSALNEYFNFTIPKGYFVTSWIIINGNKYTYDSVVVIDIEDFKPIFGVIRSIITIDNKVYFVLNELKTINFNQHFYCYEILKSNTLVCKNWTDLYNVLPTIIQVVNSVYFVKMMI